MAQTKHKRDIFYTVIPPSSSTLIRIVKAASDNNIKIPMNNE
jgi:hypothetical protein